MDLEINSQLYNRKADILAYFRTNAQKSLAGLEKTLKTEDYREKAKALNVLITEVKESLIKRITATSESQRWTNVQTLDNVLMITYCSYIVMIEYRNNVWPYEYMTFSRRIGELWEPFCKLCWEHNKSVTLFEPPLFTAVKKQLSDKINSYIDNLTLSGVQKDELKIYYNNVWDLVTSGEVQLGLDLHFEYDSNKFVVDFKSGFSSNEKGNTNRLLLVGSIYKMLDKRIQCLIFVRSEEDQNNGYLKLLKKSGIWEVYCGNQAYDKMREFTKYDIKDWIKTHVAWEKDFDKETYEYIKKNSLTDYLIW